MIEGYIGRPGSGKTYTLTSRVLRSYRRYEAVYANYSIDVPNLEPLHGPQDLLGLEADVGRKALVVIDEAHLWFPARLSMKLPPSLLMKLSQTRKGGWDLLWSVQHESRVDRVVRDVSNWFWHCGAWPVPESSLGRMLGASHPWLFWATCYEPERFRKPKKHVGRIVRGFSSRVAGAYDTLETLQVADHVNAVRDHYRKKEAAS